MINKIKNHKVKSVLFIVFFALIVYMTVTNTLSYPYIMISRQVQMIKHCYFGTNEFKTSEYGFSVSIPSEYCFLPNRLFPEDGSIQILPKGLYSVINEYAKGTVITNSKTTLLFEPIVEDRNTQAVLNALIRGGFMVDAKSSEVVNKNGLNFYILRNVKGVDETKHYDWAFITHPNGKIFLSILLTNINDSTIFDYIIENIKAD